MHDLLHYLSWYFTSTQGLLQDLLSLFNFCLDWGLFLVPQWLQFTMPRYAGGCEFFCHSKQDLARTQHQQAALRQIRALYMNPESAPSNGRIRVNGTRISYIERG